MLTSVIDLSEGPQFPFKLLLRAKRNMLKKQSEDCFISTRFIEFIIAKFYSIDTPFIIKSVKELMFNTYSVLLINNNFLLFIKEYLEITIDLQFIIEIKKDIDSYVAIYDYHPIYMFISYENSYLNGSIWLSNRTGCYLLNRNEIFDFISQYNFTQKHWIRLQNNLKELDTCTNSQNVHERKVYRQAAEGFFMRVSDLINKDYNLQSDWYFSKNKVLTLSIINSKCQCRYSLIITNTGVFETYVDANIHPHTEEDFTLLQDHFIRNIDLKDGLSIKQLGYNESDNNYLCEIDGIDWFNSEWEISKKLVKLQKFIHSAISKPIC